MHVAILAQKSQTGRGHSPDPIAECDGYAWRRKQRSAFFAARSGIVYVPIYIEWYFKLYLIYVKFLSKYIKAVCLRKDFDQGS